MKKKFKDALHRYKVEAFKISHNTEQAEDITKEILASTEEALNNAYHYQFRREPNPERIETFNSVKNFTLRAILPPVLEKVMRRIHVLEKQHVQLVGLLDELLELLSEDETSAADKSAG